MRLTVITGHDTEIPVSPTKSACSDATITIPYVCLETALFTQTIYLPPFPPPHGLPLHLPFNFLHTSHLSSSYLSQLNLTATHPLPTIAAYRTAALSTPVTIYISHAVSPPSTHSTFLLFWPSGEIHSSKGLLTASIPPSTHQHHARRDRGRSRTRRAGARAPSRRGIRHDGL